ncbi:hypothetical protein ACFYQT_23585 [Streptomyces tibetensis]|uniref:Transposase n=1 Tax=Streptomyces tibetensis TaxID=2382123 RepID=A0ABW6MZH4_9ACTN
MAEVDALSWQDFEKSVGARARRGRRALRHHLPCLHPAALQLAVRRRPESGHGGWVRQP